MMSKIYKSKVFWALFSLLISLILWAFISSQDTTPLNRTLTGVPVQFIGEDTLREERGLAVSGVDATSVNVTLRGSRTNVGRLDASDLVAVIDVSNITQAGEMSWSYSLRYLTSVDSSEISIASRAPETISFTVSALARKTIEVRGFFDGSLAEGFSAEDPVFEPSTITVTGSEAALRNIDYARVSFSRDNVDSTFSVSTGYTLIDIDGNEYSTAGLTFSTDVIRATLPVRQIKEVPLAVTLVHGAGATEENTTVNIEPQTITLRGDSAILDGINRLVIATIDLTDFTATYEDTFPITIDNELENVTGTTQATVRVEIIGLETRTFEVTNISWTNPPAGHTVELLTQTLPVTIRATAEQLDAISAENIRAVADLTDYADTEGTVTPTVRIYVDGASSAGALGTNQITLSISGG